MTAVEVKAELKEGVWEVEDLPNNFFTPILRERDVDD